GFLLSGSVLVASSLFFFDLPAQTGIKVHWAPVALWLGRMILALLLVVALFVEKFLPRSRHPKGEIAGALFSVVLFTYIISTVVRRLPPKSLRNSWLLFPPRRNCFRPPSFLFGSSGTPGPPHYTDSASTGA